MYEQIDAVDIVRTNYLSMENREFLLANMNKLMPVNSILKFCSEITNNEQAKETMLKNLLAYVNEDVSRAVEKGELKPVVNDGGKYNNALKLLDEYNKAVGTNQIALYDYLERIYLHSKNRAKLLKIRMDKYLNSLNNDYVEKLDVRNCFGPLGEDKSKEVCVILKEEEQLKGKIHYPNKINAVELLKTQKQYDDEIQKIEAKIKRLKKMLTPDLLRDSVNETAEYEALQKEYQQAKETYEIFHEKYLKHKKGAFSFVNSKKYKETDNKNLQNYIKLYDKLEQFPRPVSAKKVTIDEKINLLNDLLNDVTYKKYLATLVPVRKKPDVVKLLADYEKYYMLTGGELKKYGFNVDAAIRNVAVWLENHKKTEVSLKEFLKNKGLDEYQIKETFMPLYKRLQRDGIVAKFNKLKNDDLRDKALFEKYYGAGVCALVNEAPQKLFVVELNNVLEQEQ